MSAAGAPGNSCNRTGLPELSGTLYPPPTAFFTAATGWVWNLTSLIMTRALFGAGEAGCFPNLTKAFTTWLPGDERVRAQGIMWMSARWGGAFTPLLVVLVFDYMSWRRAFEVFGLLGVLWAIFFYRWYRDNPRDHKSVNKAELAILHEAQKLASGHGNVPWKRFCSSRTVWMLWIQYFCLSYGWYFYVTWMPTYFSQARHLNLQSVAYFSIIPLFFGGIGNPVSVFIARSIGPMVGGVAQARRIMAYFGFTGAAGFLLLSTRMPDPLYATLAIGLASFSNDLVMPGAWAACMDVGGAHAGSLSGTMNMAGNIGGAISPLAIGYILRWTDQNWNLTFYLSAAIYLMGVLCWMYLDPVTPLEHEKTY
jgi:MFS family permease